MTQLTRWNPFQEMASFFRRFDDGFAFAGAKARDWAPSVDIRELPEHFEVVAELPGLDKKDVEVSIDKDVLTIKGERKDERESKDATMHRVERSYGKFERSFWLPGSIDAERIDARFDAGVLTVKLAKRPEEKKSIKAISIK